MGKAYLFHDSTVSDQTVTGLTFADLPKVGRTSVTVKVEVFAERYRSQGDYSKVTEAQLTYVAIDEQGKPQPIKTGA